MNPNNVDGSVVIQIMGDESPLTKTLKNANKEVQNFASQLDVIEDSLKLNPGNIELLEQKFNALSGEITATTNKLNALKSAEQDMSARLERGEIGREQYAAFRREILNTEAALRDLTAARAELVDESGNIRQVTNEVGNLSDNIDNAGQSVVTFGDLLKANILSEYIRSGINRLAGEFASFVKKGVTLASDLQEVQNVVDTTFGDGAAQIYEWADAAAESFGMSSLAAQEYTGTMGAMLKSMGLADAEVRKMSTDMVGLAGDIASFYNLDVEEAFNKIRSGISGETEPLKQLGINMSVANLEAYALAQGIETAYDKMSQSEQAILRYNYLMSVTADAQGDFAKTSDSFANQQRILELQMENLSATLGKELLPYLNDTIITINEKLPQAERSIENIGKIIGKVTGFVLDNHEAIISLVAAYGTFYGAMKAGTAITTAVNAIKSLTTATQAATTAQEGMNAAAAANPYVLIVSAIAALVVGLVAYSNSLDNVHNRIKDINEAVDAANEKTRESIDASEAEIAVIEDKARQYEALREKQNRTAGEEEKLKSLAEDLQEYMPKGTNLVDEQTGAYNSLADSIDSVTAAMRRKATLAAYEEEYTELIKRQLAAEKAYQEAQEKSIETVEKARSGENLKWGLAEGLVSVFTEGNAYKDVIDAEETLNGINDQLAELENKILGLHEESAAAGENAVNGVSGAVNGAIVAGEAYSEEMARINRENMQNYENELKAEVDLLDSNLDLRRISEEEYYRRLENYLKKHQNHQSKLYFEQLSRVEDFNEKQLNAQEKADEESRKAAEKALKDNIEAQISELKERQELNNDFTKEMMYDEMEIIISGLDKESDLYKKYASEILKGRKSLADDEKKAVGQGLDDILKEYQNAFDKLDRKRQNYRNKLMKIGGDLFSINETEEGDKQLIVNNIDEQIREMERYASAVKKLKDQGASEAILSELTSLSEEDSAEFAKNLAKMSDAEFAKINDLYAKKQQIADELAADLYASDYEVLTDSMNTALEGVADGAEEYGILTADNFADAFKSELEARAEEFADLFKNTSIAAEIKATVDAETARYSAAAHTAPININYSNDNSAMGGITKRDLEEVLGRFNKPINIYLDRQVIGQATMQYEKEYRQQTGG